MLFSNVHGPHSHVSPESASPRLALPRLDPTPRTCPVPSCLVSSRSINRHAVKEIDKCTSTNRARQMSVGSCQKPNLWKPSRLVPCHPLPPLPPSPSRLFPSLSRLPLDPSSFLPNAFDLEPPSWPPGHEPPSRPVMSGYFRHLALPPSHPILGSQASPRRTEASSTRR